LIGEGEVEKLDVYINYMLYVRGGMEKGEILMNGFLTLILFSFFLDIHPQCPNGPSYLRALCFGMSRSVLDIIILSLHSYS
jgi:hypothetical protein